MDKKYKINRQLDKLTRKEHLYAMVEIPKILDVSINTFHNYRRIKAGDTKDIPYDKVVLLEHLFGLGHGELAASKPTCVRLRDLYAKNIASGN